MFYILFVFVFPVYKEKISLLILSFFLGLSIDILSDDGGINAFATVFVAYYRLPILNYIKGSQYTDEEETDIKNLDNFILLFWIALVTFIHHFLIFSLENFSFYGLGRNLLKTILSTIFTTLAIFIILQLFSKKKSNEW